MLKLCMHVNLHVPSLRILIWLAASFSSYSLELWPWWQSYKSLLMCLSITGKLKNGKRITIGHILWALLLIKILYCLRFLQKSSWVFSKIVFLQKYIAIAGHTLWKYIWIGSQCHVCTTKRVPAATKMKHCLK